MKALLLALALIAAPAFAFQTVQGEVTPNVTPANTQSTICKAHYTDTVRPPVSYTNTLKSLLAGGDEAAARSCAQGQYSRVHHWRQAVYACAKTLPLERDRVKLAQYALDHQVPLSVGGHPDSVNNLAMQSLADAKRKDVKENSVHRAVCSGAVPLHQGQRKFINQQ